MNRTVKASRERLAGMLGDLAEGWAHQAQAGKAMEALGALEDLAQGADVVVAGHTEYRVDDTDNP